VAVFAFADLPAFDEPVPIEMRFGVERTGDTDLADTDAVLEVIARNPGTGQRFAPQFLYPESTRPVFFSVPPQAVSAAGELDLIVSNTTVGQVIGVSRDGAAVIADRQPFVWNLLKGFAALWLMCVLASAAGVCASTFVSWPIAVVLTVLVLTGKWAIDSVRDVLRPGFGSTVAQDLYGDQSGAGSEATAAAVEGLRQTMFVLATLLPDLNAFAVDSFVERGQSVPWSKLGSATMMSLLFALPLAMLAYVILRNKEVAK
jgi:hypothetical protein